MCKALVAVGLARGERERRVIGVAASRLPTMVIQRNKHRSNYTVMPNAILASGLSAETCGVLWYLLTKPPQWRIDVAEVQRHFGMGRDRVYRIITELQAAGYARRLTPRGEGGRFDRPDYLISDTPLPEIPDTEKPYPVEPDTENTDAGVNIDTPKDTDFRKYRGGAGAGERKAPKNDKRSPRNLSEALHRNYSSTDNDDDG